MHPFFLPTSAGYRFCIHYPAAKDRERGVILYLHPFAEEINKSRRMVALQARALADAGYHVLQFDLLGCGDSSGDFADASWSAWREDGLLAYRWLRTRSKAPLILWGLRAGCLLAASVAVDLPEKANFIFWQPVISGRQHWQQFMRLKMAGELGAGKGKIVGEGIKERIALGQAVEIAGYSVSPGLVQGLEAAELKPPLARAGAVCWLELSLRDDPALSPASQRCVEHWRAGGFEVEADVVRGPGFWQTSEIEDASELIGATMTALERLQ